MCHTTSLDAIIVQLNCVLRLCVHYILGIMLVKKDDAYFIFFERPTEESSNYY